MTGFRFCRQSWKLLSTVHQFYQLIFFNATLPSPCGQEAVDWGQPQLHPTLSLSLQTLGVGGRARAWSFGGDRRASDGARFSY